MIPPRDVFIFRWRRKPQQLTKNAKQNKQKLITIIIWLKKESSLAAAQSRLKHHCKYIKSKIEKQHALKECLCVRVFSWSCPELSEPVEEMFLSINTARSRIHLH